jgi:FAD/FMN-containing dehydrogenase
MVDFWNAAVFALLFVWLAVRLWWRNSAHNDEFPTHNWERKFALVNAVREFRVESSVHALQALVAKAHAEKRRVKVVGCGHSWSDIAVPRDHDTLLISLNGLTGASFDRAAKTATFGAGTRLRDAVKWLAQHGFAFANLPSVHGQSLAGVLATATHGSGISVGNMASFCVALALVDHKGALHQFVQGRDAEFEGVVVHLGAMGIVVEATFRVVPHYNVHERTSIEDLDALLDKLPETLRANTHVKFWPDLASNTAILYLSQPTQEPVRDNSPRWLLDVRAYAFATLQSVASVLHLSDAALRLVMNTWPVQDHIAPYDEILAIPHAIPRHAELEMAFPAASAASVIREFRAMVRDAKLDVGHILEVRFVRADDIWMSNNYKLDACHITLLSSAKSHNFTVNYFKLFEEFVIARHGKLARAHWGKTFFNFRHARSAFPRFADWNKLRERLGGNHMFVNDFLERLLHE